MSQIQDVSELDAFYKQADPWGYYSNAADDRRRAELLSLLPLRRYHRVLDIGCGNGFVTFALPGDEVIGVDISSEAISWARQAQQQQMQAERFRFESLSIFAPELTKLGRFDLIVITGVLYEQYIGKARSVIRSVIEQLLENGGILVSCHIREWYCVRFPYSCLDVTLYPYRDYTHQLEVFQK